MKTTHITSALLAGLVVFAAKDLGAAPGQIDTSFGMNGIADYSLGSGTAAGLAVQADGRILVAGQAFVTSNDFALVRFNADGSPDTSFGSNGKVTTDFSNGSDACSQVRVLSDGKILAAGTEVSNAGKDFGLVRYNADGTLDATFGSGGKTHTDFGMGNDDTCSDMVVQPDGKIVLVGYTDSGSSFDYAIARYNADGTLDTSFNATGRQTVDFAATHDIATSVALQADGRIVLAGYSIVGGTYEFSLARLNSDGSLDTTFGAGGLVTTDVNNAAFDYGQSVLVLGNGKILVAGASNSDFALARYTANGALDTTFGAAGIVATDIASTADSVYSLAELSDGKIIAAGLAGNDFAMACYQANGSLDTTFGAAGKVITDISGNADQCQRVSVLGNGKILLAGTANSSSEFAVARYAAALSAATSTAKDAPKLALKGKKKRFVTTGKAVLRGIATGEVTSVTCKLGKRTRGAKGTSAWKFVARLKPGRNVLVVTAHGPGGDSAPVRVVVVRR
jgi:uncharacterized delta-60 repeat protein